MLSQEARTRLKDLLANHSPRPESSELDKLLMVILALILDVEKLESQLARQQIQPAAPGHQTGAGWGPSPANLLTPDDLTSVQEKIVLLKHVGFAVDQFITEIHNLLGQLSSPAAAANTSKLN